jgi:hypothetical protein
LYHVHVRQSHKEDEVTHEQKQALEVGVAKMTPIARDLIAAASDPLAEGQHGYITMARMLSVTKNKSQGMYVCTIVALKTLGYNEDALRGAMLLVGD